MGCGAQIAIGSTFRWKFNNQVTRDETRNLASTPALTGKTYLVAPYDRRKARQKDGKTLLMLPEIESGIFCLNVGLLINGKHTRGMSIELEETKSGRRKTIFNHSGMLSNR